MCVYFENVLTLRQGLLSFATAALPPPPMEPLEGALGALRSSLLAFKHGDRAILAPTAPQAIQVTPKLLTVGFRSAFKVLLLFPNCLFCAPFFFSVLVFSPRCAAHNHTCHSRLWVVKIALALRSDGAETRKATLRLLLYSTLSLLPPRTATWRYQKCTYFVRHLHLY